MSKYACFKKNVNQYDEWFERNRPTYQSAINILKMFIPRSGDGSKGKIGMDALPSGKIDCSRSFVRYKSMR